MVCFPNAKINLGLHILEKRADGFHNIETVFYPVPVEDILEILPNTQSNKTTMKITGLDVPGDLTDNLCIKAYQLLQTEYHLPPVQIILHKLIPMGAGLGGGSSDGAFTLITLNNLFKLNLSENQLITYASKLGSDCAFFIKNTPALGTEKGNLLRETDVTLKGYWLVLIKPNVHIGTAEAYAGVKPYKPSISLASVIKSPIETWKDNIINDFEKSIYLKHPEINTIKETLYKKGAIYASMTGSGAAVYGIFKTVPELKHDFNSMYYWEGML